MSSLIFSPAESQVVRNLHFLKASFLSVHQPFRCAFETARDCVFEPTNDGDEGWQRIATGADSSFDGVDHTTLSGMQSVI